MKRICIIHGHPDAQRPHFCKALGDAYANGARDAGHSVEEISVGALDFELLMQPADFATPPDDPILSEREKILAADHVVIIFPLWLGSMPAKLKGFFEQMARGHFLLGDADSSKEFPKGQMAGKSARVIVTMGMPGLAFTLYFGAHGLKAFKQGVLKLAGFKPVKHTIIGMVEAGDEARHNKLLEKVRSLGRDAV